MSPGLATVRVQDIGPAQKGAKLPFVTVYDNGVTFR